jgi:hypothetical protein
VKKSAEQLREQSKRARAMRENALEMRRCAATMGDKIKASKAKKSTTRNEDPAHPFK